jgi:hypothetical protein
LRLCIRISPFLTEGCGATCPGLIVRADRRGRLGIRDRRSGGGDFERLRETVSAVRNVRSATNVPPTTFLRARPCRRPCARAVRTTAQIASSLARLGR